MCQHATGRYVESSDCCVVVEWPSLPCVTWTSVDFLWTHRPAHWRSRAVRTQTHHTFIRVAFSDIHVHMVMFNLRNKMHVRPKPFSIKDSELTAADGFNVLLFQTRTLTTTLCFTGRRATSRWTQMTRFLCPSFSSRSSTPQLSLRSTAAQVTMQRSQMHLWNKNV